MLGFGSDGRGSVGLLWRLSPAIGSLVGSALFCGTISEMSVGGSSASAGILKVCRNVGCQEAKKAPLYSSMLFVLSLPAIGQQMPSLTHGQSESLGKFVTVLQSIAIVYSIAVHVVQVIAQRSLLGCRRESRAFSRRLSQLLGGTSTRSTQAYHSGCSFTTSLENTIRVHWRVLRNMQFCVLPDLYAARRALQPTVSPDPH